MSPEVDTRLARLKAELDDHAQIARYLGLDFERPIRSLGDGYPGERGRAGREDHRTAPQAAVAPPQRRGDPGGQDAQGPDLRMPAVHPQPPGGGGAARHPAAAQPVRARRVRRRRRGRADRGAPPAGGAGLVHQHRQRRPQRARPQARAGGGGQGRVPGRVVRDAGLQAGQAVRAVRAHRLPAVRPRTRAAQRVRRAAAQQGRRGRRHGAAGHRRAAAQHRPAEADQVPGPGRRGVRPGARDAARRLPGGQLRGVHGRVRGRGPPPRRRDRPVPAAGRGGAAGDG